MNRKYSNKSKYIYGSQYQSSYSRLHNSQVWSPVSWLQTWDNDFLWLLNFSSLFKLLWFPPGKSVCVSHSANQINWNFREFISERKPLENLLGPQPHTSVFSPGGRSLTWKYLNCYQIKSSSSGPVAQWAAHGRPLPDHVCLRRRRVKKLVLVLELVLEIKTILVNIEHF